MPTYANTSLVKYAEKNISTLETLNFTSESTPESLCITVTSVKLCFCLRKDSESIGGVNIYAQRISNVMFVENNLHESRVLRSTSVYIQEVSQYSSYFISNKA